MTVYNHLNSSSREFDPIFWPLRGSGTHTVPKHKCKQYTHVHTHFLKSKSLKINEINYYFRMLRSTSWDSPSSFVPNNGFHCHYCSYVSSWPVLYCDHQPSFLSTFVGFTEITRLCPASCPPKDSLLPAGGWIQTGRSNITPLPAAPSSILLLSRGYKL